MPKRTKTAPATPINVVLSRSPVTAPVAGSIEIPAAEALIALRPTQLAKKTLDFAEQSFSFRKDNFFIATPFFRIKVTRRLYQADRTDRLCKACYFLGETLFKKFIQ